MRELRYYVVTVSLMDVSLYILSGRDGNVTTIPSNLPGITDVVLKWGDYWRPGKICSLRNFPAALLLMSSTGCATRACAHHCGI